MKHLKLISLNGHPDRWLAYVIALHWRAEAYQAAGAMIGDSPRMLRLVADTLEGKMSKFDLKPIGLDIIKAWSAAYGFAGRGRNGFDPFVVPELLEIKTQYAVAQRRERPVDRAKKRKWIADLEREKRIPSDQTFRKTLELVKLPFG